MRSSVVLLLTCLSAHAADTAVQVTFGCEGARDFVATYYMQPPRLTPLRATASLDGKTRDLMRDKDDATGWGFADEEVWVTAAGAALMRSPNQIQCKARNAPAGGGVPAVVAQSLQQSSPAPAVAKPMAFASCWARMNPRVKYYSALFDNRVDDARQWVPAFEGFLKQQHAFNGPAQCQPGLPEADAQQYQKAMIDEDRATRAMDGQRPQIIETGWMYSKPT